MVGYVDTTSMYSLRRSLISTLSIAVLVVPDAATLPSSFPPRDGAWFESA